MSAVLFARGEFIPPMPGPAGWALIGFLGLIVFVIYMIGRNYQHPSPPGLGDWESGRSKTDPTRPRSPRNRPK